MKRVLKWNFSLQRQRLAVMLCSYAFTEDFRLANTGNVTSGYFVKKYFRNTTLFRFRNKAWSYVFVSPKPQGFVSSPSSEVKELNFSEDLNAACSLCFLYALRVKFNFFDVVAGNTTSAA
jgi:hypothetical protein